MKTLAEGMTKETVFTHSASKEKVRAWAKAKEIVTIADHQAITREGAPTSQRERARANDSEENVPNSARSGIPRGNARKARNEESQKEKETASEGKVKERGLGEKAFGKLAERNPQRLEVGPTGGRQAKHPGGWRGGGAQHRPRRLRGGQKTQEIGAVRGGDFRGGRGEIGR